MSTRATRTPPNPDVVLYGIVGTWMEADVIADSVANAFAQGAERVFLLDNESPDDTIERATLAGAELALTFHTDMFDCYYQVCLMNDFVQYVSRATDHDQIWWLFFDADEFPRPEGGGTIRELIGRLDDEVRIVGARVLNHYPMAGGPGHTRGTHPIDHQPLCEELHSEICEFGHRKHPLQRWDRIGPRMDASPGFHRAEPGQVPWVESASEFLVEHHFPFRAEHHTRKRMGVLWGGDESAARADVPGAEHMLARLESLDAVYAGDWSNVHNFLPESPDRGVNLVDWRELKPPVSPDVQRWS